MMRLNLEEKIKFAESSLRGLLSYEANEGSTEELDREIRRRITELELLRAKRGN